jgi:phenylacetate-CoA ligase
MYDFIARHILAPVLDFSRGTQTIKCLKELESSQWWPRDKILELQNDRLKQLVKQSYDKVPYYRRLLDERSIKPGSIQSKGDLIKFPLLTKELIRTHQDELMASGFSTRKVVRLATDGSTCEPMEFYRTRQDQINWGFAAAQRAFGWAGYRLGDKMARLNVLRPYHSTSHRISETSKRFFERTLMLDAKKISSQTLPAYLNKLVGFQPKIIWGYPSVIELLARHIIKEGKSNLKPAAIITGAEQLYDYQRELFSTVFGCATFSYYSSWEAHAIAAECAEHAGLHISAENLIVEIVDDTGNPVSAGKEGSVVITNLHNYAMPFIRYSINDLSVATDEECPCGRGLPLLAGLSGRTADMIYTSSGKAISGTALLHVFLTPMGVRQFQLVQDSYDRLTIKVIMDQPASQQHRNDVIARLTARYKAILGEEMDIAVEFVDTIATTPGGKRKIVISSVKPPQ